MKVFRSSMLVLVALAVTVCLLTAAAAAPAPPEKKCYNEDGEEIPCASNYLQTQKAIRDASRDSGPTYTPVPPTFTPSPTATATSTITATSTAAPAASATSAQPALSPAASSPLANAPGPSTFQVLVPLLMLGCAGLIGVIVLVILVRWLSTRRSAPPGPPTA